MLYSALYVICAFLNMQCILLVQFDLSIIYNHTERPKNSEKVIYYLKNQAFWFMKNIIFFPLSQQTCSVRLQNYF